MRWRDGRRSENVEDVRGSGGGGGGFGGGGMKLGLGSLVVVAAGYFLGVDPRLLMGLLEGGDVSGGTEQVGPRQTAQPQDDAGAYASTVLGFTEDVWGRIFQSSGQQYTPPRLVLFTESDRGGSGCGAVTAAVGPFYCPTDHKLYIDLNFFQELVKRFGGPGDATQVGSFAQAYVIAHEVGHHVQTLTGISDRIRQAQSRASEEQRNALQVRMELQADCYAGVWGHYEQDRLDAGDIDSALAAAAAVGDDMIQKKTQGRVVPESFTHGSAAQRQRWFRAGFANGQPKDCDTLNAREL
jgi:predicted metalloprotease